MPGTMLANLASLAVFRGRPDQAEGIAREVVEIRRAAGNRRQLGAGLAVLAEALLDLGRPDEFATTIEEAIALMRESDQQTWLSQALLIRGVADIHAARFDRIEESVRELESIGTSAGGYLAMANAHFLRASVADARLELALDQLRRLPRRRQVSRPELSLGFGRIAGGDLVEIAILDLQPARGGEGLAHRRNLAARVGDGEPAFLALAVQAGVAAREGDAETARRDLDRLGDGSALSPSVSRRLAFLAARAALAAAQGRPGDARRDLQVAIEAASAAGRRTAALELELDLAGLDAGALGGGGAARSPQAIAAEAEALGLTGLAKRALARAANRPRSRIG